MTSRNSNIENALVEIEDNLMHLTLMMSLDKVPGYSALDTIKNYIFFLEKRVEKLGGAFVIEDHEDPEEFTRSINEELTVFSKQLFATKPSRLKKFLQRLISKIS